LNFGLWGISIFPAWLVIRHFGAKVVTSEGAPASSDGKEGVSSDGDVSGKEGRP